MSKRRGLRRRLAFGDFRMIDPDSEVLLTLGVLLAAALFSGKIAVLLRLPQVTAYLLIGVLFGPSLLNLIPKQHVVLLEPLTNLAVALVLFNLGCQFPLMRVRRIFGRVLRLSSGELSATLLLVALGLWLLGQSWEISILLGTLALATAPATTVLVLKETESEGTITEYAQALVAVNNIVAIVAFEIVFLAIDLDAQSYGGVGCREARRAGSGFGRLLRAGGGGRPGGELFFRLGRPEEPARVSRGHCRHASGTLRVAGHFLHAGVHDDGFCRGQYLLLHASNPRRTRSSDGSALHCLLHHQRRRIEYRRADRARG